jgi:hypothetical protein
MILLPRYNLPYLHIIGPALLRSPMMNPYMNATRPTPTKPRPPPPASVQVKMPFFSCPSSFRLYLLLFYCLAFQFISLSILGVPDLQRLLQSVTISPRHPRSHSILRNDEKLRVDENYKFLITIFSDLHYGEEEDGWGIDQDVNSTKVVRDILGLENANLVVLNGMSYPNSYGPRSWCLREDQIYIP